MIVLTLRTDKPQAEVGLFEEDMRLAYETWEAHRQLAETIHAKIKDVLLTGGKSLGDIDAVVCYKGPGSFTGLRIGLSVANALAYGLGVPIVGVQGEATWITRGQQRLANGINDRAVLPEYGAPVRITKPKK
ncbi:MAG: tRNA (adenosine(37)-N6)-threonylcarbamoyltransferase complex dimerization subunit type 1 TsaB [Candidatus Saccharimonadales bacterium]